MPALFFLFFYNDTATTAIYTLSLHDALPISLLYRLADLLEQRSKDLADVETKNNGKPLFESKIDVAMAIETFRYYAGWADKLTGDTLPVNGNFFTYTLREPVGVVGAIVPWNFPLNLATWKVAPALAAGCTVVLKPAHETP